MDTQDSLEFARFIVNVVEEYKAEEIVLLDLRPDTVMADFFILCNGLSDRQIQAITEHVREDVKERFGKVPYGLEGAASSGWMLMDYGSVILHVFGPEQREYYDLQGLWRGVATVLLSIQ